MELLPYYQGLSLKEIIDKRAMWQGDIDPDTGEKT